MAGVASGLPCSCPRLAQLLGGVQSLLGRSTARRGAAIATGDPGGRPAACAGSSSPQVSGIHWGSLCGEGVWQGDGALPLLWPFCSSSMAMLHSVVTW